MPPAKECWEDRERRSKINTACVCPGEWGPSVCAYVCVNEEECCGLSQPVVCGLTVEKKKKRGNQQALTSEAVWQIKT